MTWLQCVASNQAHMVYPAAYIIATTNDSDWLIRRLGESRRPWKANGRGSNCQDAAMATAMSSNYVTCRRLIRFVRTVKQPTSTRNYNSNVDPSKIRVQNSEVKAFVERCMQSVGAKVSHGTQLAEVLVAADYRGHFSHGLNRLG